MLFIAICLLPIASKAQIACPTNVTNHLACGCSITITYQFWNGPFPATCAGSNGTITVNYAQSLPIVCPTNCSYTDLEVSLVAICGVSITPVTVRYSQAGSPQSINCGNLQNPNNGTNCCDAGSVMEYELNLSNIFVN